MKTERQDAKAVHLVNEPDGLSRVDVRGPHSSGSVYAQGAHVTSFCPQQTSEVLFVSKASRFQAGAAIRGGVPICFPWFGPRAGDPDAPMHGFARTTNWQLERDETTADGDVRTMFKLVDDEGTRAIWPMRFEALFTATFGAALTMSLEVTHRGSVGDSGDGSMTFEAALHTYLRVGEIHDVTIAGLTGTTFIDKVDGMQQKVEEAMALTIAGETDRVYQDTEATVVVHDAAMGRQIAVEKKGSRSTVVWNPWIDKAARLADLEDDAWRRFVCIETANIGEHAIQLQPGETHRMSAMIRVEAL